MCASVGARASCSIVLCVGDGVARVRRIRLLFDVGGKSGKRKRGRAGIFDFLFLNFFATQIWGFLQPLTCCTL